MKNSRRRVLSWLCALAAIPAWALPVPRDGWRLELIAAAPELRHPSVVCAAPDGRVFVAEDPMDIRTPHADVPEGRILCWHPDGRLTVFADSLHAVFGMQYLEGKLYVLENPRFTVFVDDHGLGREPERLIEQTLPKPWEGDWNDHIPANFRLGMDGFFYIAVGDKGLHGAVGTDGRRVDLNGGGVVRLRPDGTGLEVMCTGNRNILDLAMDDEDEMFTYDNTDEHDWMGRLTHMVDGGAYGYPHDFIPRRPHTLWMMADYGAGAACGALAWNYDGLPERYRDSLILSDFGQRNLRRVRIARKGGTFVPVADELLIVDPPPDFRPVGISETIDGTGFYVCDWQSADTKADVTVGRLWKLTCADAPAAALPAWWVSAALGNSCMVRDAEVLGALSHPLHRVRLTAQRELAKRGASVREALSALVGDEASLPTARRHALWALGALDDGGSARAVITQAVHANDPSVQRQALRWLGEHRVAPALPELIAGLGHDDRSIRRLAATALGRVGDPTAVPALVGALDEDDLFARFAAFTALRRIGLTHPESWSAVVRGLAHPSPRVREGTGFALRDAFSLPLVRALGDRAADPQPSIRQGALEALAGLIYQPPAEWVWWFYHPALTLPPARTRSWEGTAEALEALRRGLQDEAPAVREMACRALGSVRDRASAAGLRECFQADASEAARRAALIALAEIKDEAARPAVARLIADPATGDTLWRDAVARAHEFGGPEIEAAALARLQGPDTVVRRAQLVAALGAMKAPSAVATLQSLAATDTDLRPASLVALGRIASDDAVAALRSLLEADRPGVVSALAATRRRDVVPDLVTAWAWPSTREPALAALLDFPDLRALDAYLDGLASPQVAVREKCRRVLSTFGKDLWPALQKRAEPIPPPVVADVRRLLADEAAALASPLLAEPAGTVPAISADDFQAFALAHPGDPWRGQRVFFDATRTSCLSCHAVAGQGAAIGPDLTTIGTQFGRDALIESILHPSKTIRDGYQQSVIETTEGTTLLGAVRGESPENLIVVDLQGQSQTVPKKTIKARQGIPYSLMPEGLHAAWSRDEFADLIAYVASLKVDPRRAEAATPPDGFIALFNGRDLDGWQSSPHWTARDGVLEHDGVGDHLWGTRDLGDFELRLEWRWPDPPAFADHPVIDPGGYEVKNGDGRPVTERVLEAGDSGVLLRGLFKAQANLFCYPIGSGEFWEYRESLSGEARRAVTPRRRADRPIGQWNEMRITVQGSEATVVVNGQTVIESALLPDLPARGPIGFQHEHGRIQFRNIWVRESVR